jgi:hypothetical protein
LAKYEQIWAGLPHIVCRGAEKNFIQLAQRHEDDGEPVVDLNYFKQVVAKMILFKAGLRLAPGDSGSLRAQTVAYALAWLVEKSSRKIDLNQIWERQDVPDQRQHGAGPAGESIAARQGLARVADLGA